MIDIPKPPLAPRILRGAALSAVALAGLSVSLVIIAWDADFYLLRDKYEHMKSALFGDWQAQNWCPAGRKSEECETLHALTSLEDARDVTFFRTLPIVGSDLSVQTGIRFATAQDVVDGKPAYQWCYVSIPKDGVSQQIELAAQSAEDPPIYTSLASLDASAMGGSDLTLETLERLARSHCQFEATGT